MKRISIPPLITVSLLLATSFGLQANSSAQQNHNLFTGKQLLSFAKKVERTLAKKGVRVFIIGRQGETEENLPEGIHYTHTAFAVYSMVTTDKGESEPAYVIHNLYQQAAQPNTSFLTTDFPIDYFAGAKSLKAGILIPTPDLQRRLFKTIQSDTYKQLHIPQYSAIANPFTLPYQNCTEHVLDVIQAAIYQTDSIQQIKANSRDYFEPQVVKVSGFKLFLGTIFKSDITTSDHDGPVATATFTSIGNYLAEYNLLQEQFEILPDTPIPR